LVGGVETRFKSIALLKLCHLVVVFVAVEEMEAEAGLDFHFLHLIGVGEGERAENIVQQRGARDVAGEVNCQVLMN